MTDAHTKPKILIVDDEPSARETLEALLYQEGYDLAFAEDGYEAIVMTEELLPDVVLLDLMMPGMDGFEVCRLIRANRMLRMIPIILLTAADSRENMIRGLEVGANEFLGKPVNGLELRVRVRSMLRIKQQHDALARLMAMRETLSNMVVHDMRNLVATVLLNVDQAVREAVLEPKVTRYLHSVRASGQQLSNYLDDMLLIAKMEENRLVLQRSPVDIRAFVTEFANQAERMAESHDLYFSVRVPPQSRQVDLDVSLIRRVLDNLLDNAFRFSPHQGRVRLMLEYLDEAMAPASCEPQIRLHITDEGPGIPVQDRVRIFDRFQSFEPAQNGRPHPGPHSGLGLTFCKMVTEAHGGRISVADNIPRGSIFTVEL